MSFELALRLTELLIGFAIMQQSAEHLDPRAPLSSGLAWLYGPRLVGGVLLMAGAAPGLCALGLLGLGLTALVRFDGPYNGGADRMSLLALVCLALAHLLPEPAWRELALGYLAAQLTLSYFFSGWVKIVEPDWRSGRALRDVFAFSAYPVSEGLRALAERPRLLTAAGWAVMLFELAFPASLLSVGSLAAALTLAALFHLANACLFGLNRFFWAWLAAYPAIIWLQGRLMAGAAG